jgi:uroporphyrinogen-III decarboxylase
MNSLERIFATLGGQPVDHLAFLPITMQFAGDLIGAKYRDYVTDYRVLVEAQLRLAEEFEADLVSVISDPGRESADCGAAVIMPEDSPPSVDAMNALLAEKADLLKLNPPKPEDGPRMTDRIAAVEAFHAQVGGEKFIEGWVEGPCALGADLRGLHNLMMDFYEDPGFIHDLFAQCVEIALSFARAQKAAGANWMGVGDAAAHS